MNRSLRNVAVVFAFFSAGLTYSTVWAELVELEPHKPHKLNGHDTYRLTIGGLIRMHNISSRGISFSIDGQPFGRGLQPWQAVDVLVDRIGDSITPKGGYEAEMYYEPVGVNVEQKIPGHGKPIGEQYYIAVGVNPGARYGVRLNYAWVINGVTLPVNMWATVRADNNGHIAIPWVPGDPKIEGAYKRLADCSPCNCHRCSRCILFRIRSRIRIR